MNEKPITHVAYPTETIPEEGGCYLRTRPIGPPFYVKGGELTVTDGEGREWRMAVEDVEPEEGRVRVSGTATFVRFSDSDRTDDSAGAANEATGAGGE